MEIHGDNLDWRTACENLIFDEEGSADLLQRLESTLQHILKSPESLTVQLTGYDMVICDLPPVHIDIQRHETTDSLTEIPEISSDETWTNTESTIRKILSEVSRVPEKDIGRQQTVFNLGLDSISVIKVTSLLRKCSLNITTSQILKAATIFNMGQIADAKASIIPVEKTYNHQFLLQKLALLPVEEILLNAEINLENVHKILPSTPGQVYMLSCWQNSEGSVFYPTFSYHASERLEKPRLNEAWETLCKKSPILRTTFASTGDRQVPFVQVILKENLNPITWLAKPELQEAFDTSLHKPLVSLGVYLPQYSTTTTNIFLKIHHALYDGVSLNILIQQLQELYQNPQASLEVETSFEDFLAYNLNPAGETAARGFWTSYLSENSSTLIPVSESKPTHTRTSKFAPNLTSTGPLSTLARSSNLTFQALFLASYAHIHAKLISLLNPTSPSSPPPPPYIILGIYLANRSHPLENLPCLAAPTLNLVPIRVRAPLSTPILEIAATIQRDLQEISSARNSMVGLWEIQDRTGVVVDCFVNFLSLPDNDKSEDDDEQPPQWKEVSLETISEGTQKTPLLSLSSPFKGFDSNPVAQTYKVGLFTPVFLFHRTPHSFSYLSPSSPSSFSYLSLSSPSSISHLFPIFPLLLLRTKKTNHENPKTANPSPSNSSQPSTSKPRSGMARWTSAFSTRTLSRARRWWGG